MMSGRQRQGMLQGCRRPTTPAGPGAWFPTAFLLAVLCLCSAPAGADEVVLSNGDRITGTVKVLTKGKLTIEAPYTKPMELDWGSVREIRIEATADFLLEDGSHLKGTARTRPGGGLEIVTESAGTVVLDGLSRIDQINPPVKPPITYKGDLQLAASYLTGNTETVSANLSGKFVARSKRQRLTVRGRWYYSEDKRKVTAREAGGSIKYDFFVQKKLYTYLNTLFEYDAFKDLDLRTTLGGGLGYQVWEEKRKKLGCELGLSYVNEDFRVAEDDSYAGIRWSMDFEYQVFPDKVALFHYHEGYVSMEDMKDMFIRTEQGVRFTVLKNFYTSFQANVTYDNTPSPGKKNTDTALLFGLGYDFDL